MRRHPCPLLALVLLVALPACGEDPPALDLTYRVPMQQGAYWPRFRRTEENRGWSPVLPGAGQKEIWTYQTGKGIFSSPVIDKEGTIYLGSADAVFYAIRSDGTLAWKQKLGELVDSAAVIGEDGTIYAGSGDGNLYAFGPGGEVRWKFKPRGGAFITWFEGNVVIGPDGALYAGNDDFHMYSIDRATGSERWSLKGTDQIWSAVGFDDKGLMYYGANDLVVRAVDLAAAAASPTSVEKDALRWKAATLGTVVSSPLVTKSGKVIFGSFDGFIYGAEAASGKQLFKLPTREHIYASAAQAPDGTLYLPSGDGTLYAFDEAGTLKWSFDTLDPIRSSPAVGGDGTIYFGGGDGRLYALNPDGTRRWSLDTSEGDRNDLNASPSLGKDAIYITGEDGKLWSVPYDYCLRSEDKRCSKEAREDLPEQGAELYLLTPGGSSRAGSAQTIGAGEAIALRLVVREKGDTVDAAIDSTSLKLTLTPPLEHTWSVAADGSFLAIVPATLLPEGTTLTVRAEGDYLVDGLRMGNMVTGGRVGGRFDRTLSFTIAGKQLATLPLAPTADEVQVLDMLRLAVPQPVMLPSYNQIGFDFMHLLVGIVELDAASGRALGWVSAARVDPADPSRIVVDTSDDQKILFPLEGRIAGDSFVLDTASFRVEFAAVDVPMDYLRIGGTLGASKESSAGGLSVYGTTTCANVEYYGTLLKVAGLCNFKTDQMVLLGTAQIRPASFGGKRPAGLSAQNPTLLPATASKPGSVRVELAGALPSAKEHVVGLLLLDTSKGGKPYPVNYSQGTKSELDAEGKVSAVTLSLRESDGVTAGSTELVVLHDFFPIGRFKL